MATIGLLEPSTVEAGYVTRIPKAYPVYDESYQRHVATLREWLAHHAANVYPVGRNGMHRYNNQDHSMLTAMLAVENILDDAGHDLWSVNVDDEYHEERCDVRHGMERQGRTAHRVIDGSAGVEAPERAVLDEVRTVGAEQASPTATRRARRAGRRRPAASAGTSCSRRARSSRPA